uniref:Uncharacterized protein n=1 Tax=Rhizophora mucronata TaxID=61149 RepID=A0A2P2KYP3_RHIMU
MRHFPFLFSFYFLFFSRSGLGPDTKEREETPATGQILTQFYSFRQLSSKSTLHQYSHNA